MTPETAQAWQRVLRDAALSVVGTFCLIFGVVWVHEPTRLSIVLGCGLSALGVPPLLRVDERRRQGKTKA